MIPLAGLKGNQNGRQFSKTYDGYLPLHLWLNGHARNNTVATSTTHSTTFATSSMTIIFLNVFEAFFPWPWDAVLPTQENQMKTRAWEEGHAAASQASLNEFAFHQSFLKRTRRKKELF